MIDEKNLDPSSADKIGNFVRMNGGHELVNELLQTDLVITLYFPQKTLNFSKVSSNRSFQGVKSKSAKEGLENMKTLLNYCDLYGCSDVVSFDLSLARGLDYYTGVIYEAVLLSDLKDEKGESIQVGSVAGGGRYDKLVSPI